MFECKGPVTRVSGAGSEPPLGAPSAPSEPARAAAPPAPKPDTPGEPRTVVEAVKRANAATDEQLKKSAESLKRGTEATGSALANGAKKTWDCLASLFSRCK